MDGAEYWRFHGKRRPVALRAVAQAIYGVPASTGVMERNFCIADFFMPHKRGSLDPARLEMLVIEAVCIRRAAVDHLIG